MEEKAVHATGVGSQEPMEEGLESLQRDVQRRLGRNLIRLQQIERLSKIMVAEQEIVATTASTMETAREGRRAAVRNKTLGQVSGQYFDKVVLPTGTPEEDWEPDDVTKLPFRHSFRIEMAAEQIEAGKERWRQLIELRNELVHHFLEFHDIWTVEGCRKANGHLDDTLQIINGHLERLNAIGQGLSTTRRLLGEFAKTKEFFNCIAFGGRPCGAGVDWTLAPVVQLLRDAERDLSRDGWTKLDLAISWLRERHPDHTPKKYQCSTWRQVLHESKQFEIRRDSREEGGNGVTYFRSTTNMER